MGDKYDLDRAKDIIIKECMPFIIDKIVSKETICLIDGRDRESSPDFIRFILSKDQKISSNLMNAGSNFSFRVAFTKILADFNEILKAEEQEFLKNNCVTSENGSQEQSTVSGRAEEVVEGSLFRQNIEFEITKEPLQESPDNDLSQEKSGTSEGSQMPGQVTSQPSHQSESTHDFNEASPMDSEAPSPDISISPKAPNNQNGNTTVMTETPEQFESTQEEDTLEATVSKSANISQSPPVNTSAGTEVVVQSYRLPNARVGSPFEHRVDAQALLNDTRLVKEVHVDVSGIDGLSWDAETLCLSGQPLTAGEFSLAVRFEIDTQGQKRPSELQRYLLLTINPDPKSLWKNLKSDPGLKYWKQDRDSELLPSSVYQDKWMIAASERGRSHAHVGSCRDDDYVILELPDDWLLMAVADGAGSARYSRHGSKIACEQSAAFLKARLEDAELKAKLDNQLKAFTSEFQQPFQRQVPHELRVLFYELLPNAALKARKEIEQEAARQSEHESDIAAKDYATTLQLCLAKKLEHTWFFCTFAIGDGMTAVYAPEHGGIHLLAEPDSGEYSGQTRFLTMGSVWSAESLFQRLQFLLIPDFTACLLMTDGVSDPKFASDLAMQETQNWAQLWEELDTQVKQDPSAPDKQLLTWLNFWSEGEHDDRTLALLTGALHAR